MDDPLQRLRDAGFDMAAFTKEQVELLSALTDDEVTVLLDIKERLDEVTPEVQTHNLELEGMMPMTVGGLLF